MNDFTGIQFGSEPNTHSSDLGFIVVSDGSRYSKSLLPTIQNYTTEVPGGDGSYYFGSEYKNKDFTINIAFDKMSELQMRKIRKIFGDKEVKNLIFDEEPYKVYKAKVTSGPDLTFICFLENNKRVYKGEGTINLSAFMPYAILPKNSNNNFMRYIDDYTSYANVNEWKEGSGMRKNETDIDAKYGLTGLSYDTPYATSDTNPAITYYIYNAGDKPADYILEFDLPAATELVISQTKELETTSTLLELNLTGLSENRIKIDSQKQLILVQKNNQWVVSNDIVTDGSIFKFAMGHQKLQFSTSDKTDIVLNYSYYYL